MTITPSVTLNPFGWEQFGATDDFTQLVIADAYGEIRRRGRERSSALNGSDGRRRSIASSTTPTRRSTSFGALPGDERAQVVADFENEHARFSAALRRHFGVADSAAGPPGSLPPGVTQLQLSWVPGSLVAWGGGHRAPTESTAEVRQRLADLGARRPTRGHPMSRFRFPADSRARPSSPRWEACSGGWRRSSPTSTADRCHPAWSG